MAKKPQVAFLLLASVFLSGIIPRSSFAADKLFPDANFSQAGQCLVPATDPLAGMVQASPKIATVQPAVIENPVLEFSETATSSSLLVTIPTATPSPTPTDTPEPTISQTNDIKTTDMPISPSATLTPSPSAGPSPTVSPTSLNADYIFSQINNYRTQAGLPAFEKDDRICQVARERAPELYNEIMVNGNMHAGFFARNIPYQATENIIYMRSEDEAVQWWLHSSVHRAAIFGDFKYSCVACSGQSCSEIFTNFQPK